MDDYKQRVLDLYDQRVLTPELGEGSLKRKLLSELEIILDNAAPSKNLKIWSLNKNIDYAALRKLAEQMGHRHIDTRIAHALEAKGIRTYSDLFIQYEAKKADGYRYDLATYLKGMKNFGSRSANVLLRHFELLGLKILQ